MESLRRGEPITVVDDHYNSPTLVDNLAEALLEIAKTDFRGIFHMAGSERINRYKFAVKIAKKFNLDAKMIRPIKMSELNMWIAKRPRDCMHACYGVAPQTSSFKESDRLNPSNPYSASKASADKIRDWIYVTDHCEGLDLVFRKGKLGEIYNISAGNELENVTVAELILYFLGKSKK